MTTRKALICLFVLGALGAPAMAQLVKGQGVLLKKEADTRKMLLGIDMEGYSPTYRMSWRECIQPDGETLYETPDEVLKGRLDISPTGLACFSYEDTNFLRVSCFKAYKSGKGVRFEADDDPNTIFVTTRLVTGVKSCKPKSLIS